MKAIPDLITILRMLGSLFLPMLHPLSIPFLLLYLLCGFGDWLDGFLARKLDVQSRRGQVLDSLADLTFFAVTLVVFLPLVPWEGWVLWWVGAIALLRFVSLGVGFARFHTATFLHTYGNKVTGVLLFLCPLFFWLWGQDLAAVLVCVPATLSALEELYIVCRAKVLDRDVKGIFARKDAG
jgi:cardiolipin synthase